MWKNELYHHGILGMKWGVRRYQNADGTLTEAGKRRYYNSDGSFTEAGKKRVYKDALNLLYYNDPSKRQKAAELSKELANNDYIKEQSSRLDANYISMKNAYKKMGDEHNSDESRQEYIKAFRNYNDLCHRIVKEMLGKYSHEKINEQALTLGGKMVDDALHSNATDRYARRSEIKKEALDRAKNTDSYDIDFLETVQNDPVLSKGGKELLKEYSKYLDDPNDYMRTFEKSEYFKKHPKLDHLDNSSAELYHHGILGMKWGIRRYQNADGSLTDAGRKRYTSGMNRVSSYRKKAAKYEKKAEKAEKSAHRFWMRDAEAAYAKYSKYKYKAAALNAKADKLEGKLAKLAGETSTKLLYSGMKPSSLLDSVKSFAADKAKQKKIADSAAKRQATIAAKRQHEAEKKEALDSGDPNKISKFKNELSNDELRAATDRIRLMEVLNNQSAAKIKTGMDRAEEILNKVDKARGMAEKGISAYNLVAKVYNSTHDDKHQLPSITGTAKKSSQTKAIEKAIKSGDPDEILKWKGKMTSSQTTEAMKTVNNWSNIEKKSADNAKAKRDAAETAKAAAEAKAKEATVNKDKYYQWENRFKASQDAAWEYEQMTRDWARQFNSKSTSKAASGGKDWVDAVFVEIEKERGTSLVPVKRR